MLKTKPQSKTTFRAITQRLACFSSIFFHHLFIQIAFHYHRALLTICNIACIQRYPETYNQNKHIWCSQIYTYKITQRIRQTSLITRLPQAYLRLEMEPKGKNKKPKKRRNPKEKNLKYTKWLILAHLVMATKLLLNIMAWISLFDKTILAQ